MKRLLENLVNSLNKNREVNPFRSDVMEGIQRIHDELLDLALNAHGLSTRASSDAERKEMLDIFRYATTARVKLYELF